MVLLGAEMASVVTSYQGEFPTHSWLQKPRAKNSCGAGCSGTPFQVL